MDEIWKRDEIDSPCINLCVIHPKAGICMGCFRTMDEISTWSSMPNAARKSLIAALPDREKSLHTGRKRRRTP